MANPLNTPVETLEDDLSRSSWIEVHYLDSQGERREVRGSSAYIEMRLVMPQDDGQTVEVPFERMLLAQVYEQYCSYCSDPMCQCGDNESRLLAHWVERHGKLIRLP